MEIENATSLLNAFRSFVRTVTGGNYFSGNRAIEVGTPISDYPIQGIRRVTFIAVADDGALRNPTHN